MKKSLFILDKNRLYFLFVFLLLFLGAMLRFNLLGSVPKGMTWDEAAIGYNGYAVLTTRRDEWLKRLPISFWSFGDYKAPLAIYLNGLFTFSFGMNLWAVRLPFALSGVLAVAGMIFLTKELVDQFLPSSAKLKLALTNTSQKISLVAGLLIVFSPWHLHYSRAGFESGIALMFLLWGVYGLWRSSREKQLKLWSLLAGITLLILSIYTYHSAKVVVPLLVVLWGWWKRKILTTNLRVIILSIVWGLLLLVPFIYDSLWGQGLTRAGTLVFSQGWSTFQILATIFGNMARHLSPSFLIMGETTTLRHGSAVWGVLLITTYLLCIWSVLRIVVSSLSKKLKPLVSSQLALFALGWIVIGILPAALGTEIPHSNRALLALPGFILLATWAVIDLQALVKDRLIIRTILGSFLLAHIFFALTYLNYYYTLFAKLSADDFREGYLEAFAVALDYERGENGKKQVDKIIFTSQYGQPYIYALFVRKTNPIWYQGGSLIKYEFKEVERGDLSRKNSLVVAHPDDEMYGAEPDQQIMGSDGKPRFNIYVTQ